MGAGVSPSLSRDGVHGESFRSSFFSLISDPFPREHGFYVGSVPLSREQAYCGSNLLEGVSPSLPQNGFPDTEFEITTVVKIGAATQAVASPPGASTGLISNSDASASVLQGTAISFGVRASEIDITVVASNVAATHAFYGVAVTTIGPIADFGAYASDLHGITDSKDDGSTDAFNVVASSAGFGVAVSITGRIWCGSIHPGVSFLGLGGVDFPQRRLFSGFIKRGTGNVDRQATLKTTMTRGIVQPTGLFEFSVKERSEIGVPDPVDGNNGVRLVGIVMLSVIVGALNLVVVSRSRRWYRIRLPWPWVRGDGRSVAPIVFGLCSYWRCHGGWLGCHLYSSTKLRLEELGSCSHGFSNSAPVYGIIIHRFVHTGFINHIVLGIHDGLCPRLD